MRINKKIYTTPCIGQKPDGMPMSFQVPKDIQEKLARFEQLKTQLQILLTQKGEMESRSKEIEEALKALGERAQGDVYRRIGDLMFRIDDPEALKKELSEEGETLSIRLKSMEKQEKSLKEMYEKMGSELNEALKGYQ
ncbi:MAG: prefoldin subunit beta [Thermoplasmatota archaeon]